MANEPRPFDVWRFLKRSRMELGIFALLIGITSIVLPWQALVGLWSLLATKVITVTMGVFLAHLLRIVGFYYLDLSEMIEEHHTAGVIFLAIWYAVIVYAVAVGG